MQPRGAEARPVWQGQEELEGSDWAERTGLEGLEQGVTVALDDPAPLCHRRHGYNTERGNNFEPPHAFICSNIEMFVDENNDTERFINQHDD